jgi:hypothetical protein
MSNETGDTEIYVRPFPDGAGKWQVSTNAGLWPRWRRDGRELFFIDRANHGKLVSVDVTPNGSTFESAAPKELFQTRFSNIAGAGHSFTAVMPYAVSADGQRFLIAQSPASSEGSAPSPIAVVLNWPSAVKK